MKGSSMAERSSKKSRSVSRGMSTHNTESVTEARPTTHDCRGEPDETPHDADTDPGARHARAGDADDRRWPDAAGRRRDRAAGPTRLHGAEERRGAARRSVC